MRLDREEVRRIATLACLEFDAAGEAAMAAEMSRILDYIDQLREIDVALPTGQADGLPTPLRADVLAPSLPVEEVEDNAPRFAHGHFVVPRIIGGD